ncbi:hypothetical protein GCM10011575_14020 [Microlunatus endophyticus]|uniref:Uncharacterized protein n=1 Tax=Microlunatus endophyticus TaxID=1716077 RepID=A0A917S432_9ACTN|nr:hypothetical protein [Microlunatus endophyticus]GGL56810.1 hypothetical protein GCM10011575_14020 [Microlunatus endophyticus]
MSDQPARWNAALAYAITGQRWDDLAESGKPELVQLADEIRRRYPGGVEALQARIIGRVQQDEPWPYEVPDDLRAGLGAAQWWAALSQLRRRLAVGPQPDRPVLSDRKPDADEQRLLRDVPPHHGH